GDVDVVREAVWGTSFDDETTARHVRRVHQDTGYLLCPHTAVGHLGMEAFKRAHPAVEATFVTVGTAHPAKFTDSLEGIIHDSIPLPAPLQRAMSQEPRVTRIDPTLEALSDHIAATLA
ncbi:MAG: threonine synthase, partial [Pseudomonadota bacterium]